MKKVLFWSMEHSFFERAFLNCLSHICTLMTISSLLKNTNSPIPYHFIHKFALLIYSEFINVIISNCMLVCRSLFFTFFYCDFISFNTISWRRQCEQFWLYLFLHRVYYVSKNFLYQFLQLLLMVDTISG